jgi:amino acid adenylation domain-containing protein
LIDPAEGRDAEKRKRRSSRMYEKTYSSDMAAAASQYYNEREYWLEKLSGDLVKSTFPIDLKAPGKKRKMETVPLRFSREVVEKLLWMSNESDFRLLMLLIAGLAALIQTYTDNNDIILGTPIYKQSVEGKFLNTVLPLRNRVEGNMNFKELLYQVKQTINQAVKNQNYPLKSLLYELNLPYSEEDFPLFDIALMVENIQERKYIHHIQTNMMFTFSRVGNRLDGRLEYNSEAYLAATAERICSHFNRLLEQLLFHIDTPLSHIDLLPEQEKKRLVEDFNNTWKEAPGTEGVYQADRTLHSLFEEQVERTPDQTAIVFIQEEKKPEGDSGERKKTLTYQQLNEKANGLARVLRKNGVGTERIAALLMESSISMVTAVLAVLKAGGAYLPIDLEAPLERKTFILKESGAHLVLTDQPGESTSFSVSNVPEGIETLDVSDERVYDPDTTPLDSQTQSSDLAYIIYTSGSTGKPKGVLVEHGHVVNTLVYRKEEYRMDSRHTALQLFSYAFDGFLTSFFTPIISGARVVILSKQTIEDITRIVEVIAENQVTHFISVPILYQAIMNTITQAEAASLQVVTLAGDQVHPHLLELTAAVNKNIEIVNEYGITEAGVMSTVYRHQEKDPRIKIGFPAWNTRIYITRSTDMDDRRLLSVGVYGEMCIAGAGVARGYMNNPDLTAARFTEDPFLPAQLGIGGSGRHRRMLKTGDMARRLPDGNIEFMGRIDHQVKIRGFRIEPGEIENQLLKQEEIKEAVVIARGRIMDDFIDNDNDDGDKYLCAYVVSEKEIDIPNIKESLGKNLPEYMIPAYFVQLEQIPLTPNGKVDRKALPKPEIGNGTGKHIAPRNQREEQLANIWSDILRIEKDRISIDSNFFPLGGHSLNATILAAKIHRLCDVKVPLVEIFERYTIRKLAEYIEGAAKEKYKSIEIVEKRSYYDVSYAQKRLWILDQLEPGQTAYNVIDSYVFEKLKKALFEQVLKMVVKRHEILRTTFTAVKGEPKQKIHTYESVGFNVDYIDLRKEENPEELARTLSNKEASTPFHLEKGPLLRAKLFQVNHERHIFLITMHHIISDGWSLQILINEVKTLYNAYDKGQESPLRPLKIQYKDFASWHNQELSGEHLNVHQSYWRNQFRGEIPVLNLKTDYPRPSIKTFNGKTIPIQLEKEIRDGFFSMNQTHEVSTLMILIASIMTLLYKYTGQEDIIVGLPVSGREHIDLEDQVGFYINIIALRTKFAGNKSFENLLNKVKQTLLGAFDHQLYPFDRLVEELTIERDMSRSPLFDVVVQYINFEGIGIGHGQTEKGEPMKGVSTEIHNIDYQASKYDLVFNFSEMNQRLYGSLIFNTDLFQEESIVIMIERLKLIFREIVGNPGIVLKNLDIEIGIEKEMKKNKDSFAFEFD